MLLAIDEGNTNMVFAVHDGERWIAQWRAATDPVRTADEYAVWLSQLLGMAGLALGALDACVISGSTNPRRPAPTDWSMPSAPTSPIQVPCW